MGRITGFMTTLAVLNTLPRVATAAIGLALWARGAIDASAMAMAFPLRRQIAGTVGRVSWEVTRIFENLSSVQEGMRTIAARPRGLDAPDAVALRHGAVSPAASSVTGIARSRDAPNPDCVRSPIGDKLLVFVERCRGCLAQSVERRPYKA
jgi:hypothetical protein